mmetsp:Transcript_14548/g.52353  ORF Transcript_14548/g.52353 Transcript_14548/m.52353 type:complete len:936 (+) Transcript_14548:238-3045(+)
MAPRSDIISRPSFVPSLLLERDLLPRARAARPPDAPRRHVLQRLRDRHPAAHRHPRRRRRRELPHHRRRGRAGVNDRGILLPRHRHARERLAILQPERAVHLVQIVHRRRLVHRGEVADARDLLLRREDVAQAGVLHQVDPVRVRLELRLVTREQRHPRAFHLSRRDFLRLEPAQDANRRRERVVNLRRRGRHDEPIRRRVRVLQSERELKVAVVRQPERVANRREQAASDHLGQEHPRDERRERVPSAIALRGERVPLRRRRRVDLIRGVVRPTIRPAQRQLRDPGAVRGVAVHQRVHRLVVELRQRRVSHRRPHPRAGPSEHRARALVAISQPQPLRARRGVARVDVRERERVQLEFRPSWGGRRSRRRAAGRRRPEVTRDERVNLLRVQIARDVHLQRPRSQLRLHRGDDAVQRQRGELLARGVHEPAVAEHGVVYLVVRHEFQILPRVELEHAVDVLDAFERVLVPHRLRREQVDDLERALQPAVHRERGVEEEVLRLRFHLEHDEVLHRDELDLLPRPPPDAAHLLQRAEADRGGADAAGPGRRRLRGASTGDDEAQERAPGLVVRDAIVHPEPVGEHALVDARLVVVRRGDDRGLQLLRRRVEVLLGDELIRDEDVLHGLDLAVVRGEHVDDLLLVDVKFNLDALRVRRRRRRARDDGRREPAAGIPLLNRLAVLREKTQELARDVVAAFESDDVVQAHESFVALDLVHHDVTERVVFHDEIEVLQRRHEPSLLRELLAVAHHRRFEPRELARGQPFLLKPPRFLDRHLKRVLPMQRLARHRHRGHRAPLPRAVAVVELAALVVLVVELRVPRLYARLQDEQDDPLVHRAVQIAHASQRQNRELAKDVKRHVRQVLVLEELHAALGRDERLVRVVDARGFLREALRVDLRAHRGGRAERVTHRRPRRVPLPQHRRRRRRRRIRPWTLCT